MTFAFAYVLSAALFIRGVARRGDRLVRRRLDEVSVIEPVVYESLFRRVGRMLPARQRADIETRFDLSPSEAERMLGMKAGFGFAGVVLGIAAPEALTPRVLLATVLGAGGYVAPTFRLAREARSLAVSMRRAVPDLLDLMAVSVSAGMTPRRALERAITVVGEPLRSALGGVAGAVSLGTPWLDALGRAAAASRSEELGRLASTLAMSFRLGSPVAGRVRALARDVRSERRADAEARARRAPVTMLFPLVFLILPAFVLTAVAPALIVAMRGVR